MAKAFPTHHGPAAPGLPGTIRQLRPSDYERFRDHLLRLDLDSRRDRFNGPTNDAFVSAYADRCFHDGTIVVGYVEGERVLGAAELHERPDLDEPTGEIAFSVEKPLQHRGLGGLLLQRLIAHAHALDYSRLFVTTHPDNAAMKRLARKFNAHLHFEDGESVGMIELAEGDPDLDAQPWPRQQMGTEG